MGHKSWIVKTDAEHYDVTKNIATYTQDILIVGAARVKKPIRNLEGSYFQNGDLVLLLHYAGESIIKQYPEIFCEEYCQIHDIRFIRSDTASHIDKLEYLTEKQFRELIS
jgi:hypothetical protein